MRTRRITFGDAAGGSPFARELRAEVAAYFDRNGLSPHANGAMVLKTIGVFAINGNTLELYLGLGFGVMGYVFRKLDIPLAPMVLSLVLGGIMEQSFRQAMTISGGNPKIFVGSPICVTLVALSIISIFLPLILKRIEAMGAKAKAE